MSKESAELFVQKLNEKNQGALSILPAGFVFAQVFREDFVDIATSANAQGWDFTVEEFRAAYNESLGIDEEEN